MNFANFFVGGSTSILRPSSADLKVDNSVEMMQLDVGDPQQSVQIFPLSANSQAQHQQQQANVMCLSIVNGKIQNIRDPAMQSSKS